MDIAIANRPKLNIPIEDRPAIIRMLADRVKWSADRLREAGFHIAADAARAR